MTGTVQHELRLDGDSKAASELLAAYPYAWLMPRTQAQSKMLHTIKGVDG